jgi:hypothetical protein
MKIKGNLVSLLVAGFLVATTVPALAMGTGNPYEDAQVGLNYVVYQPSYLAGLSLKNFGMHKCGVGDLAINSKYSNGKKSIFLTESSTSNICPITEMLIRGATRTVITEPGGGSLTTTQVTTISVGIERAQLNVFFSHLVPRYTSPGKAVPPVLIDPTIVRYTSVSLKGAVVFVVPDPNKWSATIGFPKVVSFIASKNHGIYVSNPGLKPLKRGRTVVTLNHNGKKIHFTVIVY